MTKRTMSDYIDDSIDYNEIFTYKSLYDSKHDYSLEGKKLQYIKTCFQKVVLNIKDNNFVKAIEYLDKIIKLDPLSINAYKYYSLIYIKQEDIDNLMLIYAKLQEIDPHNYNSYNYGICYLKKYDINRAEIQFKKTIQNYPLNIKAREKLIHIYKKVRNIFEMYSMYREILSINPSYNTTEYILLNFDNIIKNIKKIYFQIYNENIELTTYEDILFIEDKYKKTYRDDQKNIKINLALASYVYIFDINRAIAIYKYIISIDNNNLISHHNLLRIYLTTHLNADIESICLDIIKINSNYVDAYYYLAIIYNNKEDLVKSNIYCNEVLKLDESCFEIYFILASINTKMNNVDSAVSNYLKIIESDPTNIKAYFKLANLFFNNNRLIEAEESYLKVLELDPYHIDSIINIDAIITNQMYII